MNQHVFHASEGNPITIPLPEGGFEAVQGVVSRANTAFRNADEQNGGRLSVTQEFMLQQTASAGILNLLEQMNVGDAASLAVELENRAAADPYTDMLAVELDARSGLDRLDFELQEHRNALAEAEQDTDAADASESDEQGDEAAILQLEEHITLQHRYVRMAEAVGATSLATVAVVTGGNPEAIKGSVDRAIRTVKAVSSEQLEVNGMVRSGTVIGSIAAQALTDMLAKLENPPLQSID